MELFSVYPEVSRQRLEELLARMDAVRIGLIGDVCLDVYWLADMRKSELSRETPHHPLPIVSERMSAGAGGNVAANMAALNPKLVKAISAVGCDWRSAELKRVFINLGIDAAGIITDPGLTTNAYCKPLRTGISDLIYEDPRLDFTNYVPLSKALEDALMEELDNYATSLDVLCVSDQFGCSVITPRVRDHISRLAAQGLTVVADSRENIGKFTGVILKPNELEGAKAAGIDSAHCRTVQDYAEASQKLSRQSGCEVLMTIGAQGSLYTQGKDVVHIPVRAVAGPIDICGAGDSFLSGFSLALAAGADRCEAAVVASLCSGVTIQQIGTTGTATREQVLERYEQAYGAIIPCNETVDKTLPKTGIPYKEK
jgi:D-glycero-beta-D-manno-heptose-7-phosphate kinase